VDKKYLEAPASLAVQEKTGTDNWHDFIVTEILRRAQLTMPIVKFNSTTL
jgi:hypothetical protein